MTRPGFVVRWAETAVRAAEGIKDLRIRRKLHERAGELAGEPEARGKRLQDDLKGLWSVRAVGQRYRIVYRVDPAARTVWVVAVGIRKEGSHQDIYALAEKLVRQGLLHVR